jgi:hypothetical protein
MMRAYLLAAVLVSGANAQDGTCDDHRLSSGADAINKECCDEPTEDCTGGYPHVCNAGCAALVMPYWDDCSASLGELTDVFEGAVALCSETENDCFSMALQLDDITDALCCEGAGLPACPDVPPDSCTAGCASFIIPYWDGCSDIIGAMDDGSDPLFAAELTLMDAFATQCVVEQPPTSDADDICMPMLADIDALSDEMCCPGGFGGCPDGPPSTCSKDCAKFFEPFWAGCGPTVRAMDDGSADYAAQIASLDAFNTMCLAAHPKH